MRKHYDVIIFALIILYYIYPIVYFKEYEIVKQKIEILKFKLLVTCYINFYCCFMKY